MLQFQGIFFSFRKFRTSNYQIVIAVPDPNRQFNASRILNFIMIELKMADL